ncbi:MAG TPA: amino acid adenylation domain-containing protein [Nostocaceae cyanobacterium]|nr:amino acid adenylation domain-containing protein [Nostocaceae cyanobacterium]
MNNISRIIPKNLLQQKFVCNRLITAPQGFNGFTKADTQQSIISRFEQQVNKYPDAIAVKTHNQTLTYQQLNQKANQLANTILSQRGNNLEVIAILLDKSANFFTSIFGILKTGKIFVPLDPTFPIDRLADIITDSQASIIITNNQNLSLAQELAGNHCAVLNIEQIEPVVSSENPRLYISPHTPAYIIYTSGSTGKPKGVVHNHLNSLHYCMNDTNTLLISPEDRVVFLYSCSALGGILCIFYTLLNGASLCSFDVKKQGLNNLVNWLIEEQVTVYHSFATLFRHFVETLTGTEDFSHIRLVKLGGEATIIKDVESFKKYFNPNCILYASLGATETGTFRNYLIKHDTELSSSTIPIGYAVEDMEVVLLDETGEEVARGEIGEIAVKSKYLALSYWQNPELTAKVFLPDRENQDTRIYRTGDLGVLEHDGCLVHKGRKDFQVKIRGFRIEVAEIEMVLLSHGNLKEAVVIAREDIPGDKRLVAYLVPKKQPAPTTKELRQFLQQKLPDYMLPGAFVCLDALPLTPNGKTDRRALPAPNLVKSTEDITAPNDNLERELTQIWEEILGIQPVGVQDNFFELGGNSLLAARLFAVIEKKYQVKLPLATLLQTSTIDAIAKIIREIGTQYHVPSKNWSSLVPMQTQGSKPPLFLIHALGGELLCYRHFITHLGLDQPIYGLQPQGLDGKKPPLTNIEDIAIHYIQEIQSVQPQGPYFLAGYSFGGLVGYEIAQQLQKQGQEVAILAMLDTCRPGYSQKLSFLARIPIHLNYLIKQKHLYIWQKAISFSKHIKYLLQQGYKQYLNIAPQLLNNISDLPANSQHLDVIGANAQAINAYHFQPYSGKVILFRTADEQRKEEVGVRYDPQFGWGEIISGGLDVYYIPGSHLSLLEEPNVKVLAKKFKSCLEAVQTQ